MESEKTDGEAGVASNVSSSPVTTPSNGIAESLNCVHEGNGLTASSYRSNSTNGGTTSSPTQSLQASKTLEDLLEEANGSADEENICENASDDPATIRVGKDQDINSVFIKTSELPLDLEDQLSATITEINTDGGPPDSPLRFGNAAMTTSTSSDLSTSGTTENGLEFTKLKELCSRARFARCRARFPIPVILYKQKHICRYANLF